MYRCVRKDGMTRRGGGIVILIDKTILFAPVSFPSSEELEVVAVSISLVNKGNLTLISTYFPQGNWYS